MSSELPSVTQAVGGSEDELSGSQLDHSYIRPAKQLEDGETHYIILQPVSQSEAQQPVSGRDENQPAQYSFAAIPQVGENVEITSSSVQEEGDKLYSQEDVKPNLTELAVPGSGDGRSHFTTLAHQDLRQQIVIKQEMDYSRGKHEMDVILALIYQLPVDNVPYSVDYEDLVKALATPTDKVSVRVMRKTLPCLRIVAYMKVAEFVGKKKIKGLWNQRPYDWPNGVPYKDPNNGEKVNGQPVPKANSGDLRAMFKFLKAKFMANIKSEIDTMSEEDKANLPEPPKMAVASVAAPMANRRAPKRAAPAKTAQGSPPRHSSQLPVFVQEEHFENTYQQADEDGEEEEEEEEEPEAEAPQSSYRRMDSQSVTSPGHAAMKQYVDHFAAEVQEPSASFTNPGTPREVVCLDDNGQVKSAVQNPFTYPTSATASRTASLDQRAPLVVNVPATTYIKTPSPPAEPKTEVQSPTEAYEKEEIEKMMVTESGLVSSMPVQRQDSAASVKKLLVQPSDDTKPFVVAPQQPTSLEMGAYMNGALSAQMYSAQPPAMYNPSMFSIMQAQTPSTVAATIVRDLLQRLKEKIMYLQNITLGDEEISACLSRMFSQMIQPLHTHAMLDPRYASTFILAAHKCESLMDKAMTDGKKLSRKTFLDECNVLTEEYGSQKVPKEQNLTVFNSTMPEHPPVQSDMMRKKLQDVPPDCLLPPKSPGTFLKEKFCDMNIQSPSDPKDFSKTLEDLTALGIRQKKSGPLDNVFEPRAPVVPPSESENKEKTPDDLKALEAIEIECLYLAAALAQSNMDLEDSATKSENEVLTAELLKMMQSDSDPMMTQNDPFMTSTSTDEVKKDKEAPGLNLEVAMEKDLILNDVIGLLDDYGMTPQQPQQHHQPQQPQQAEQGTLYSSVPMSQSFHASPANAPAINNSVQTLGATGRVNVAKPVAAATAYSRLPMNNSSNAGKARPSASRPHGKMPYQQHPKRNAPPITWINQNNPVRNAVGLQPSGVQGMMAHTEPPSSVIPSTVLMAEVMDQDQDDSAPRYTYNAERLPPEKR